MPKLIYLNLPDPNLALLATIGISRPLQKALKGKDYATTENKTFLESLSYFSEDGLGIFLKLGDPLPAGPKFTNTFEDCWRRRYGWFVDWIYLY